MTSRLLRLIAGAAAVLTAACTVHSKDAPALSGPSALATSLNITATPDHISLDGASQSSITVQALGPDGRGISGLPIHLDLLFNGSVQDYGSLTTKSIVTGSDGTARAVYTAPSPTANQTAATVTVRASALSNDSQGTNVFTADIRLMPTGVVLPPAGAPTASFAFTPTPVSIAVPTTFDASASTPGTNAVSIASYAWDFGDGTGGQSGRIVTHTFTTSGSFRVSLTVTNDRGLTATTSQTVAVSAGDTFTGDWFISPLNPVATQSVIFNANTVQAQQGHVITSYTWNFGDGDTAQPTSGPIVTHTFAAAGSYNVQLTVVDDLGRSKVFNARAIAVSSGNPSVVITFSPTTVVGGTTLVTFNSSGTTFSGGATAVSYLWDFGDGTTSTAANPTHTFPAGANTYTVRLTVTDSQGRSGSTSVTVTAS